MKLIGEQLEQRLCCCAEGEQAACRPDPQDVNADGAVDRADVRLLERLIDRGEYGIRFDVNCDAVLNNNDVDLVMQAIGQGEYVPAVERVRCDDPRYLAADITYDGRVDSADVRKLDDLLTAMALAPGKTELYDQRLYNVRADINCDGAVDLGDLGLLNVQYGLGRDVAESLWVRDTASGDITGPSLTETGIGG